MVKVFDRLKQLSTQNGTAPPGARDVLKLFLDTGKLGEPTAMRKKLQLPGPPQSGTDELKDLIRIINKEKNKDYQEVSE